MAPGVAEYREPGAEPERIFLNEQVIKNMDPTFEGRPMYVGHVDKVSLPNLESEMAGVVVRSFYNKSDGKHWAEFMITSDAGHDAIRKGWRLSNAYVPKAFSGGGNWHGVQYAKEVMRADYDHLAIVPVPRYDESIILSPEEFKAYNEKKEQELQMLTNQGDRPMLSFFKRSKVENSSDLENHTVVLPKSKKEITIAELVTNADSFEEAKKSPKFANGDDMVQVGDDAMTVNDLVSKHMGMKNAAEVPDGNLDEEAKKQLKNEEDEEKEKEKAKAATEKKKVENEAAEAEKEKKKENFKSLKNAHTIDFSKAQKTVEISQDKSSRGRQRYGS